MSFGKDYSSTEKLWKKSLRTDLRRQKRRLVQKGKLSLWIASSKEDVLKILPEFFDVYNSKWLSQKKPSYLSELPMQEYCYRIVENVWGKGLHFSTLKCDDLSISYHFGFKYDGWLYWYKPTYRIDFHTYSPSKLHISYLVHEGIKSGLKGVDFLQGDEFYKKQWAMETKETVSFIIGLEKYSLIYYWFSYAKPWLLNIIGKKYLKLKASFGTIFLNRENTQF
jgi:CelD/BcsL family acetyltransferase involved in cellulose biosynthesis